jgi:hypothetical protein
MKYGTLRTRHALGNPVSLNYITTPKNSTAAALVRHFTPEYESTITFRNTHNYLPVDTVLTSHKL